MPGNAGWTLRQIILCLTMMATPTRRSPIWLYFTVLSDNNTKALCNTCKETISRGNVGKNLNTTNLISHIRKHHANLYIQGITCYYCIIIEYIEYRIEYRIENINNIEISYRTNDDFRLSYRYRIESWLHIEISYRTNHQISIHP